GRGRVEGHGRGSDRPTRRRGIVRPRATHGPGFGTEDDVGRGCHDRYIAGDADNTGGGGDRASRHRESGVSGESVRPLGEDAARKGEESRRRELALESPGAATDDEHIKGGAPPDPKISSP